MEEISGKPDPIANREKILFRLSHLSSACSEFPRDATFHYSRILSTPLKLTFFFAPLPKRYFRRSPNTAGCVVVALNPQARFRASPSCLLASSIFSPARWTGFSCFELPVLIHSLYSLIFLKYLIKLSIIAGLRNNAVLFFRSLVLVRRGSWAVSAPSLFRRGLEKLRCTRKSYDGKLPTFNTYWSLLRRTLELSA